MTDDSECTDKGDKCKTGISYSVDGKAYTATLDTGSDSYDKGSTVQVYYDKTSPKSVVREPMTAGAGWAFIVGAILLVGFAGLFLYLATSRRGFASVLGVGQLI